MESRRHLRVVPSNAPTFPDSDAIHRSPTQELDGSLPICPNFNNDIDCRVCGLQHACSICLDTDHGSYACKKGFLRVSSGNVGSGGPVTINRELKVVCGGHYAPKPSSALDRGLDNSALVASKLEHRKSRRALESKTKSPLYHRVEFQSPRYVAYREKCRNKGDEEQTWPDHLEEAFQRGL